MKFMTIVKSPQNSGPPPKALMDAIDGFFAEATQAGVIAETGGLKPTSAGARVRISRGKLSITDGPFTEAKEVIGGYAVFEVKSKGEAVEWTRRFMELHREHWPGWDGETEIRELFGQNEFPPAD